MSAAWVHVLMQQTCYCTNEHQNSAQTDLLHRGLHPPAEPGAGFWQWTEAPAGAWPGAGFWKRPVPKSHAPGSSQTSTANPFPHPFSVNF